MLVGGGWVCTGSFRRGLEGLDLSRGMGARGLPTAQWQVGMVGNMSGAVRPCLSHGWAHRQGHGPQARSWQSSVVHLGLGGIQGQRSLL